MASLLPSRGNSIAGSGGSVRGLLRCGILARLTAALGQNLRLPQRNIGIRFTSISRHSGVEMPCSR
jgi:hypothetical protein